jgi:hypothetical protein
MREAMRAPLLAADDEQALLSADTALVSVDAYLMAGAADSPNTGGAP